MRTRRSQIALAAVALVLGFLVVTQVRSQSGGTGLEDRSAQDLTLLVANLNTRNDQLRGEVADLGRQLDSIVAAQARGDTSAGQLRADLVHVRIWAGVDPAAGQGVRVMLRGPATAIVIEEKDGALCANATTSPFAEAVVSLAADPAARRQRASPIL